MRIHVATSLRSVLALLFLPFALVPAAAQTEGVQMRATDGARPSLRAVLTAAQTAPPTEARRLRDRAALSDEERRLVDALLLQRDGDLAGSERALRDLLAEDASRRLVRFELARVLIARERYTAARFQLDRLIASEPDRRLRRVYAALDAEISRRRPWDFSLSLRAAPSTNANRGAEAETFQAGERTFTIDDVSRARSGIGFGYSASASRRFEPFGAPLYGPPSDALYVRAFVSGVHYEESALRSNRVGVGAFWRHRFGLDGEEGAGGLFGPGAFTDVGVDVARDYVAGTLFDGDLHADLVTPYLSVALPLGGRFSLSGRTAASHVGYDDALLDDGWRGANDVALTFAPQPGLSVTAFAAHSWERSGREPNQYDGVSGGLSGYAELPWSVSATLTGTVGRRDYRAPFPGAGFEREDRFWKVEASFTKRDWALFGFAPRLSVSHEDQRSNVSFYTFTDTGANVSLSRSF